jgi:hypothetical protein
MKKALAIISAVALVGVAAFAEDAPALKLSGYVDTGIKAVTTDNKAATDTYQLWGDDSGSFTRFDLNGSYVNGDAGVDFKLRTQDLTAPAINHFEAWTFLADKKVKLVAGKLDTSAWKTDGDDGFTAENNEGIQVQILPVAGLNLGVKFNTPSVAGASTTYKANTTTGEVTATTTDATNAGELKYMFQEIGFGAKYTTDLYAIAAGYTLDSKGDGLASWKDDDKDSIRDAIALAEGLATKAGGDDSAKGGWGYVGVKYNGIKNLKLVGEAKFVNTAISALSNTEIDEIIEYTVSDPLTVGFCGYQDLIKKYTFAAGTSAESVVQSKLSFKPYASYVVNSLVKATGEVKYTMNDGYLKDVATIDLKPGVVLQVSPNSQILINDNYEVKDLNKKASSNAEVIKTNTFQVNFRFNF